MVQQQNLTTVLGVVRDLTKVLVAFDIRIESLTEVDLPNVIDNMLRMDLAVLREHLCLSIYVEPGLLMCGL